jgi:hypothetical protein|nr:unknown Function [uncultured bacterium]
MSLSNAPIADDFHADTPHRRSELRSGMRHVLVFAKTPYVWTPYDRWLAGWGIEPIILTPQEYASGYRHLRHVHAFDGYDDNQLVDKAALDLARAHEPDEATGHPTGFPDAVEIGCGASARRVR